jgi:hypothetical protein
MSNEAKYWILANKAAKELGWLPETVFTQWAWETAHFTSSNLKQNNNIAGQTWYQNCGHEKGSARPANEGGWYIKYDDAAQGYVEFIKKNIDIKNIIIFDRILFKLNRLTIFFIIPSVVLL